MYFSYGAGSLVTSVTSDFGVSLSYQYDNLGNLVKVTKPDNTFMSFEYSPAGLLTAVKDSSGKILESHTYDILGRGITSSRAGNVDSVTVSY
jgi:YD repeat-containing protein